MEALWITATLLVAIVGGWPVTAGLLKFAKSKTVRAVDAAEAADGPRPEDGALEVAEPFPAAAQPGVSTEPELSTEPEHGAEVLRGGLLIGVLERAAVAVAILAGQPVAIAYVVAIKGLGRYPELKDTPAASERFIIGTLASMLFSASVAVLAKALLL
ncbi:hypothetical protein [Arthrobacter psychrochitiniphilus]|uniref:Uncharacterized protein n=1 Tax=Arthrobacter psychrochitiniphilus TaxID=291045 RepID=A0A2V3DVE2_9MICC|nr:hypothetical protein [Arthrobacter psychrochitiniphilus]NYG16811.1 hypothetical protein [Arthrobacter psychrochitiniphilus]PXA69103.1 hypothetical protein CVS29_00515 [Arthrobacter psychrochitiniphilus]